MNGLTYFELPSRDFDKAKAFYSEVFGWRCELTPEKDYMMMNTMDGPNGGFSKDIDIHSKPGINIYLEVADIEKTIAKAEKAGGKCLTGKTQISLEYGYYAFIEDLEGNKLGLWARN